FVLAANAVRPVPDLGKALTPGEGLDLGGGFCAQQQVGDFARDPVTRGAERKRWPLRGRREQDDRTLDLTAESAHLSCLRSVRRRSRRGCSRRPGTDAALFRATARQASHPSGAACAATRLDCPP